VAGLWALHTGELPTLYVELVRLCNDRRAQLPESPREATYATVTENDVRQTVFRKRPWGSETDKKLKQLRLLAQREKPTSMQVGILADGSWQLTVRDDISNYASLERVDDYIKRVVELLGATSVAGGEVPTSRRFSVINPFDRRRGLHEVGDTVPATHGEGGAAAPETVFIGHGHDDGLKHEVANVVEKLIRRRPVILHEQANAGQTIIEKFERHSAEAAYAIVLATADDMGGRHGRTEAYGCRIPANVATSCSSERCSGDGVFHGISGTSECRHHSR
jgi:Predicted nucleotide-binding protein containing TIR-like domain